MEIDSRPRVTPSPWLAPIIGACGLIWAVFWGIVQIRHWNQPEVDYMPVVVSFITAVALAVFLAITIWLNLRDMHRAKSIQQTLDICRKQAEETSTAQSDRIGQLAAENKRLGDELSNIRNQGAPVIQISWGEIEPDAREHEQTVAVFESTGMPRKAAEFAAVGRPGYRDKEKGFALIYRGGDSPLENVTIQPLSKEHYRADFETLPCLEKGVQGYLIPHISVNGHDEFASQLMRLFCPPSGPYGILTFTVTGLREGLPFMISYRAEGNINGGLRIFRYQADSIGMTRTSDTSPAMG
jgi:hypothetical protein